MQVRFIGDIHGDFSAYRELIDGCDRSVQVGDFGIGFLSPYMSDMADQWHGSGHHQFIRGNHDNPDECPKHIGYIEDGTWWPQYSTMFVGGAWSIDWKFRTSGYSWWPNEELSDAELDRMHELYLDRRPRVMVTHDCPTSVAYELFLKGTDKKQYLTRTAEAFERMFLEHQPEVWLFGHWHLSRDRVINGTRFLCLDIDSYIDLEL